MAERNTPAYPSYCCFTTVQCQKCGEWYEPICKLDHICKKQNSYPIDNKEEATNG